MPRRPARKLHRLAGAGDELLLRRRLQPQGDRLSDRLGQRRRILLRPRLADEPGEVQEGQPGPRLRTGLPGPAELSFGYDANNRLVKAGAAAYEYDPADNLTKPPGTANAYDAAAQLERDEHELRLRQRYEDADGNVATTAYDLQGRPVTTTDNKGSQTIRYDSVTGLPVELEDSAAGIFTASYDADGNLVKRGLPNGLTAETTYDEAGQPVHLTYAKQSFCGASCTWLDFGLERSVYGQILSEAGSLGTDRYGYEKAGRLTSAQETPQGGQCTTRAYAYDADSNRKSLTTRSPGVGGACAESGGTTKTYSYDAADRLLAEGLTYDAFGRITKLPGSLAGGKELTTSYFSNDMVATQSQNVVTNSFELDASLRQRSRLQAGGLEGVEVFHYDAATDSPGLDRARDELDPQHRRDRRRTGGCAGKRQRNHLAADQPARGRGCDARRSAQKRPA